MHFRDESQKRDFIRAVNAAQVALEDDNAEAAYDIVFDTIRMIEASRAGELSEKINRAKHARRL